MSALAPVFDYNYQCLECAFDEVGGALIQRVRNLTPTEIAERLATLKLEALAVSAARAETARQELLPAGPGQTDTYRRKEAEARRFLSGDDAGLIYLPAEAAALNMSIADLAAAVVSRADAYHAAAARIEAHRRAIATAIGVASDLNEVARINIIF